MSIHARRHPLEPFREEILKEAVAICRGEPAGDLRRPRVAHLRGVMAMTRGQFALAIAYLALAIRLKPSADAYSDLGDALLRRGRQEESIATHLRAVKLSRGAARALDRLGSALLHTNRLPEAAVALRSALQACPDDPAIHAHFGDLLGSQGLKRESVQHYVNSIRLAPDDPEWVVRLGRARLAVQDWDSALVEFRRAIALNGERADAHVGAADALLRLGRIDQAIVALRRALNIDPRESAGIRLLVFAMELAGRKQDAVGGWAALGAVLEGQGRPQEACAAYRNAMLRKSDCLRAHLGLGRCHLALNEPENALFQYQRALEISPESIASHVGLGLALHAIGQIDRGWQELAWHHDRTSSDWRHVEQPLWTGFPLAGRTVLLWADASLSHTILGVRYAQMAKGLGGRVIVECDRSLMPLVRDAPGVDRVVPTTGPCLPYDVHTPLRYLPALVPSASSFIPETLPYLHVPNSHKLAWDSRLGRGRRTLVGVAWIGEPGESSGSRFLSLSDFEPLKSIEEICLVSLQLGPSRHELLAAPSDLVVREVMGDDATIADLAAVVANVDLVVTSDGVVAHIAGALGVPVWTLLSRSVAWPWPSARDSTPWYPSMRFFRQQRPGHWNDAIEAVCRELRAFVGSNRPACSPKRKQP